MDLSARKSAFSELGRYLNEYVELRKRSPTEDLPETPAGMVLDKAVENAGKENHWFTRENVLHAIGNIAASIEQEKIERFTDPYYDELINHRRPLVIGVVAAGNIPLVGFHDFFCTVMAGYHFRGKLSSDDRYLLPAIAEILFMINPDLREMVSFIQGKLTGFDAIIATGSNNTNRYFDYYFGKYPHVFRKNRNSVAILTGEETIENLSGLADDIFWFFGRGCRSVSKLYLNRGFSLDAFREPFRKYIHYTDHSKYNNNYKYYKAVYLLDRIQFVDMGHLLLTETSEIASPVSVLYYEFYDDMPRLLINISERKEQIQCMVAEHGDIPGSVKAGKSQNPELWDYADGIDTMQFLLRI